MNSNAHENEVHIEGCDENDVSARVNEPEFAITFVQQLPKVDEARSLPIQSQHDDDDDSDDDSDGDGGHVGDVDHSYADSNDNSSSSFDKASLIRSGSSSKSFSDSMGSSMTEIEEQDAGKTFPRDYKYSIMADFQASLFLPSLMLSSYSTIWQSFDQTENQALAQDTAERLKINDAASKSVSLIERLSNDRGASFSLTLSNLMPYLIGSFLFAMPYSIQNGGFVTMLSFAVTALLADISAVALVDSMYEISPKSKKRKRICRDYVDIAREAFGEKASRFLNCLLLTHLFTSGIVCFVLLGQAMRAILIPYVNLSRMQIMAIFAVPTVPTLFVRKLSVLAYLSIVTILALFIGAIATLAIFIKEYSTWESNIQSIPCFDWEKFAYSLSMWLYTVMIHPTLPQIEGSIKNPAGINKAIHLSLAISTLIKVFFGLAGAVAFGTATHVLVTHNIIGISYVVSVLVNAGVVIYAILGFPLFVFVVCDAFDSILLRDQFSRLQRNGKYHWLWLVPTRLLYVGLSLAIAIVVPYFGPLMGVFGAILGTLLAFILPCMFHLKLKWKQLSGLLKMIEVMILAAGSVFGLIGLYASIKQLRLAMYSDI